MNQIPEVDDFFKKYFTDFNYKAKENQNIYAYALMRMVNNLNQKDMNTFLYQLSLEIKRKYIKDAN